MEVQSRKEIFFKSTKRGISSIRFVYENKKGKRKKKEVSIAHKVFGFLQLECGLTVFRVYWETSPFRSKKKPSTHTWCGSAPIEAEGSEEDTEAPEPTVLEYLMFNPTKTLRMVKTKAI